MTLVDENDITAMITTAADDKFCLSNAWNILLNKSLARINKKYFLFEQMV